MARAAVVRIEGLKAFRKTLRDMDRGLPKELSKELKAAGDKLLPHARELAPEKSGKLRRSLKVVPLVSGTAIRSSRPYANFVYWGGSTSRGHVRGKGGSGAVKNESKEFTFGDEVISASHPFVHQAAHEHEAELLREFERAFLEFARQQGFR